MTHRITRAKVPSYTQAIIQRATNVGAVRVECPTPTECERVRKTLYRNIGRMGIDHLYTISIIQEYEGKSCIYVWYINMVGRGRLCDDVRTVANSYPPLTPQSILDPSLPCPKWLKDQGERNEPDLLGAIETERFMALNNLTQRTHIDPPGVSFLDGGEKGKNGKES